MLSSTKQWNLLNEAQSRGDSQWQKIKLRGQDKYNIPSMSLLICFGSEISQIFFEKYVFDRLKEILIMEKGKY